MSCTIDEPGQVSNVGTTRPTPLPDRVGASMLGAVVSQIGSVKPAENDTIVAEKTRGLDSSGSAQRAEPKVRTSWLRAPGKST